MQCGWSATGNTFLPAVKDEEALWSMLQAVERLSGFTAALFDSVVLEIVVYFRNPGVDVRISENKNLTPNKCE